MREPTEPVERFEEHRTWLRALAHRMLGSLSEAGDALQEAWLRAGRAEIDEVENLGGWLTTVTAHGLHRRRRPDHRHRLLAGPDRLAALDGHTNSQGG
ncbi:sigma factor [Glycomyces tarimensis]